MIDQLKIVLRFVCGSFTDKFADDMDSRKYLRSNIDLMSATLAYLHRSSAGVQEEYNDSDNLVEYFFCCNILLSTYLSRTTSNGPPTQKIRNCHGMFFMCWRLVRKLGLLRVVVSSGRVRKSQIYELFALVICRFAK